MGIAQSLTPSIFAPELGNQLSLTPSIFDPIDFILLLCNNAYANVSYNLQPIPLETLIESSDIVLVGKVNDVIDNSIFYGYQDSADDIKAIDEKTPLVIGLYKTDFSLKVNQLLKGDVGKKSIVLRIMSQQLNDIGKINYNMGKNRDKIKKQLFFLKMNIDGTYSLNSMLGALSFKKTSEYEEETIVFEFKGEEHSPFEQGNNANSLVKDIKDIVNESGY